MRDNNRALSASFRGVNLRITWDDMFVYTDGGRRFEKRFTLTMSDVNKFFGENPFVCPYSRETKELFYSDELEHHAIPYMAFVYYHFVWQYMKLPTLAQFVSEYVKQYCVPLRNGKLTFNSKYDSQPITFSKEALIGRLSRSYNSYNREIQLLLALKEYRTLDVEYDFQDDLFKGIDISIWRKADDAFFGIASYVNTMRSNAWKQDVKNTVRHDYEDDEMIDMKASLEDDSADCYVVGGVKFYSEDFVRRVVTSRILAK